MFGFKIYDGMKDIKYLSPSNINDSVVDVKSQKESVLDLIYSADPVTGYPSGALGHYFSDNVSPEVRDFISNELFGKELPETSPMFGSSDVREALRSMDDDFLINTLPKHSETSEEYADRMKSYIESVKSKIDNDKNTQKFLAEWRKNHGLSKDSEE